MSFPRSRSHNGPTNPRNKPKLKATRKRNSRSKGQRLSTDPGADSPWCPSGRSARSRRTVREDAADGPKMKPEQPVLQLEIQTVRTLPADSPRATCAARTVRDLQADSPPNRLQQNLDTLKDPRANSQELDEHAMNMGLADCLRLPGRLSTGCGQSCSTPTSQRSTLPSLCLTSQINKGIATKS
jgi:hypothetical protein